MTLILVYTLSKTILGHSFFNYILVTVAKCTKFFLRNPALNPKVDVCGSKVYLCPLYFQLKSGLTTL